MTKIGKAALIATATAVVCLGIAVAIFFVPGKNRDFSGGVGFRDTVDQRETAVIEDISTILIDTSSADVHIITESREDVEARFHGSVRSSSRVAIPELTVEKKGDTLVIRTTRKESITFGFYSSDVRLDVVLPRDFRDALKVDTSSGDLHVSSLSVGDFDFDTSSGEAYIGELSASRVNLNSSSGDIEAERVAASITIRDTSSGSTVIERFSGDLDFRSSSGDLDLSYTEFDNDVEIDTASGEIDLTLPEDAGFVLDVDTASGDIETDFPLTLKGKVDEDTMKGTAGDGGGSLHIRTSSGDVSIRN